MRICIVVCLVAFFALDASSANTLAHEIGHLCGWHDIYVSDGEFIPDKLREPVSSISLPEDWNNGTGGRFYPVPFSQRQAVMLLLMYGVVNYGSEDISSGNVFGLVIDKTIGGDGVPISSQHRLDYVFVGSCPVLQTPTNK